jgi:hypothetical protein
MEIKNDLIMVNYERFKNNFCTEHKNTVENFILNKIDGMSMHDGHLGFAFFSFLEIIQ